MSPYFVIERFKRLIERRGINDSQKNNKYKPEREAWITAVYLLGLMSAYGGEYYVGINPEDSTPDTYGVIFRETEKGNMRDIISIEVFEWESHSPNNLVVAIVNKLKNKSYPSYFTLLCYGHSREGQEVRLEEIYRELNSKQINVGSIWLLVNVASENPNECVLTQLYPNKSQINFDYVVEAIKNKNQKDMSQVTGRGTDKGIKHLGTKYLPIP